jgi:glycosyltransferase involved in cell wall biosynthesis
MSQRSVVQVTLWNSEYLGNFMLSELALAREVRARLGLTTHFVLGYEAEGREWLKDLDEEGFTWSIFPSSRLRWKRHLDGVIAEHRGALVHAHFTAADLQAAAAAGKAGIPCVWHIRTGFNGYPLRHRLTDLLKMRIVARRRISRVIAVSSWLGQFARMRGIPPKRVEVVENAITTERFANMPDLATARESFGIGLQETVVLALGWWPEVKGVDVFVEAMQRVVEEYPDASVLLVGKQRMRDFLTELLPEQPAWLHLSDFVLDSAWLFAAADVFVSASRHEGQSSAIGEALACGIPAVMSDIPGTSTWGPAPGLSTFPSEDAAALAEELKRLVALSPEGRAAAGAENRDWVRANFSVEEWTEKICAIYAAVLAEASGSAQTGSGSTSAGGE